MSVCVCLMEMGTGMGMGMGMGNGLHRVGGAGPQTPPPLKKFFENIHGMEMGMEMGMCVCVCADPSNPSNPIPSQ